MDNENKKINEESLDSVSGGTIMAVAPPWVKRLSTEAHRDLTDKYLKGGGKAVYEYLVKAFGEYSKQAQLVPEMYRSETEPHGVKYITK